MKHFGSYLLGPEYEYVDDDKQDYGVGPVYNECCSKTSEALTLVQMQEHIDV